MKKAGSTDDVAIAAQFDRAGERKRSVRGWTGERGSMGMIARLIRRPDRGIHIDPDYSTRRGYETEFLGSGEHAVPLPSLPDELVPLAATNRLATSEPKY